MTQDSDASLSADECGALDVQFDERVTRVSALIALDRALTAAANRHNLAAQIVHHGWPHRAPRGD